MQELVRIPLSLDHERIDKALGTLLPILSREKLKQLILNGMVTEGGGVVKNPSRKVSEGQEFLITWEETPSSLPQGEEIPLSIVFEDEHVLVINKAAGMVVHPGAGNWEGTLVNALIFHCEDSLSTEGTSSRPGIVHRLDKETSGLMVVAKTNEAHRGLVLQFERRTLSRTYLAFIEGVVTPPIGIIEKNIGRSDSNRKKMAVFDLKGKPAITRYKTLEIFTSGGARFSSLVECELETGRTHQIRVHLASLGHCVLGDPLYGRHRKKAIVDRLMKERDCLYWKYGRQALHAHRLRFLHPITGSSLEFKSDLPEDLQELHRILRETSL